MSTQHYEQILESASRVAVIVPSYNRTSDLKTMLSKLICLDGAFDIYVYDDCSPTEDIKVLCATFPKVRYRRTKVNLGIIGVRNVAMNELIADYDILFHFDDDSIPVRRDHITKCVAMFDISPDIGVLAFPITDSDLSDHRYPSEATDSLEDVFTYIGCGNAWRVSAIEDFGLYSTIFERQGEEMEHSFRVWKSDYRVKLAAGYPVFHWQSETNRNQGKILALASTSYFKWSLVHWPFKLLLVELARWVVFTLRRAHKISWREWWRDLAHPRHGIRATLRQRSPITSEKLSRIRELYSSYRVMFR